MTYNFDAELPEEMSTTIYIKNMVCPRCITAVSDILQNLQIEATSIRLGEVGISEPLEAKTKGLLERDLQKAGFELLTDNNAKIIEQIKALVIEHIHHSGSEEKINFSQLLSSQLNKEYSSLTKLFSSVEGQTIEHFVLGQKIEKVKELLFYNELTLSEIAHQMHYSSTAHLSTQFKNVTGMNPTEFKKLKLKPRKSLDEI